MHIALNGWFWDQPYTGSGQVIRHLLPALRRAKPDATWTLIVPGTTAPTDVPDGVRVVAAGGWQGNLAKVWFEQRLFPTAAGRAGADIAHVPYWGSPLASPIPLVVSVLDVIPLVMPEYASGAGARLYTALVSASARGANHILTISAAARDDIVTHLGIPASAITVTHLAADERYHPRIGADRDDAVRATYNLPETYILIGFGFDRRKRLDIALAAFAYVAQAEGDTVTLVIAGREPAYSEPIFPDLRALARDLDISDSIRWIGAVDEADKPGVLRMASVFVFPSEYEGFGLPALEAMACGTPVIAADIPVMREIVEDGAFLVPPGDARKMGGAMLALLGQDSLRQTLISRALGRATAFTWRKTALATYAVYERVASESRSAGDAPVVSP
ncbi:MAG: glycosyltransferase family 1 protein [Chloroflexota bacterium]|nr:glycosyltransferase family 1 protein [Chloroflexota bacterium]